MKASSELEDGGDPAIDFQITRRALECSGDDLEQRRFSGPIAPENSDDLTTLEIEIDGLKSHALGVAWNAANNFDERVDCVRIDAVRLAQPAGMDGNFGSGHSASPKPCFKRENTA
ncbi:hypothetical protein ACVWW1_000614 [Bradyrhizobium sp. JR3.5]